MDTNRIRRVMWAVVYFVLIGMLMCVMDARGEEVNIDAVVQIESGGNPYAYNKKSRAIGLMQITPICLKEYNEHAPSGFLCGLDLWDAGDNRLLGSWYLNTRIPQMLKAYKIPDTIDNRLWAYNAGIGNVKKGIKPRETKRYIEKYHKLTKERGVK